MLGGDRFSGQTDSASMRLNGCHEMLAHGSQRTSLLYAFNRQDGRFGSYRDLPLVHRGDRRPGNNGEPGGTFASAAKRRLANPSGRDG